jgi:hypothetical protein
MHKHFPLLLTGKIALVSLGLLAFAPATMADVIVTYDCSNAALTYNSTLMTMAVSQTVGSTFDVTTEDTTSGLTLDTASLDNNSFNLAVNLQMVQLGANNWAGSGTITFTDTDTATNAVEATVATTSVTENAGILIIQGVMGLLGSDTSILVNRGNPWVFVGNSAIPGEPDGDGVPGQITVANSGIYTSGNLITLKFGAPGTDLDDLFSVDRSMDGGEVKGQVVPEPATIILSALGLLIGWVKRGR